MSDTAPLAGASRGTSGGSDIYPTVPSRVRLVGGPVRFVVHTGAATGPVIEGERGALGSVLPVLWRGLTEWLAGWRGSPPFGPDHRPVADAPLVGATDAPA